MEDLDIPAVFMDTLAISLEGRNIHSVTEKVTPINSSMELKLL